MQRRSTTTNVRLIRALPTFVKLNDTFLNVWENIVTLNILVASMIIFYFTVVLTNLVLTNLRFFAQVIVTSVFKLLKLYVLKNAITALIQLFLAMVVRIFSRSFKIFYITCLPNKCLPPIHIYFYYTKPKFYFNLLLSIKYC